MPTTTTTICSCGETTAHVIARRETADGIAVQIWHDGAVTGRYGRALPGIPVARPRTAEAIERERGAARLLADEVSLYNFAELPRWSTRPIRMRPCSATSTSGA